MPSKARTVGNGRTFLKARIEIGKPEGSPVSPLLFNLYIDSLARLVQGNRGHCNVDPIQLFSDDVAITASTLAEIAHSLDACTGRAAESVLVWNVAKSHIIAGEGDRWFDLLLSGSRLSFHDEADHLGVPMTNRGVPDTGLCRGMERAKQRIGWLQQIGVRRPRLSIRKIRDIFVALVRSQW